MTFIQVEQMDEVIRHALERMPGVPAAESHPGFQDGEGPAGENRPVTRH